MALKTAMVNRSQNATDQSKAAFEKVVKQLKECDGLIGRGEESKKKTVKMVNDYLATVPRGENDKVRNALCDKAGIHRATFFRWKAEIEEDAQIGDGVKQLAERNNRTINTTFRQACLQAYADNPKATPIEVFQKACKVADTPKERVETQPIQPFVEALNEYLRKSDNDADGLLEAIKNAAIPREKICAALKGLCP